MSERYWTRLGELLEESRTLVNSKLVPNLGDQPATEKGLLGSIAYRFQGLSSDNVESVVQQNVADVEWTSEWMSKKAGTFVEYGIDDSALAVNVRTWLEAKIPSTVWRLRIFESDIALLPVSLAVRILKVRASMKSLRSRIDVCFRILCGIEKMGRKIPDARFEKMKLQFEKLEQNARKALEKAKAAEQRAAQLERNREEREKKKQEKRQEQELLRSAKKSSAEKKKRKLEAQSNFMMRFVSKRVTPQKPSSPPVNRIISLDSPERKASPPTDSDIEFVETTFRLDSYRDKSIMPTSYWLKSLIDFDMSSKELSFLKVTSDEIDVKSVLHHLTDCSRRRKNAEKKIGPVLKNYRARRILNRDDKTPRFSTIRSDLRGRGRTGPFKFLKFDENNRPAFFGTSSTRSPSVTGRRPFGQDAKLDYEIDSDDEWEEGESLIDGEEEKERATEDAELKMLYGSDDESDDDDFLDDAEADDVDDDDDEDSDEGLVPEAGIDPAMIIGDADKVLVIDVDSFPTGNKRSASEINPIAAETKKKRRRKSKSINHARVEIIGIDFGENGTVSLLDRYPITRHSNSIRFELFDPRAEEGETKPKAGTTSMKAAAGSKQKTPRNVLDGLGILHLAMLIHGTPTAKEKTIRAFINWRQDRKEAVPTQSEVQRVISQIAFRKKRDKDTKANWYLKDAKMEAQVMDKNKTDLSLRNKILQQKHMARYMTLTQAPHPMLPVSSPSPVSVPPCAPAVTMQTAPVISNIVQSTTGSST